MNTLVSRLILPGSLLLLTLGSGVWLSDSGKPYSTMVFTIHKLIALSALIATGVTFNSLHKTADLRLVVEIGWIAITALLFLSLLVTGALMSILKPAPAILHTLHQAAPLLAVLSTAATIYLLASGK